MGASLTAGKLRNLWFLTPAPTGTQSKPSLPFLLLLPPGKMAFVPCDTLSQSVGGGRGKGLCGEQGRWVWGWRAGKVTHFALPSSSAPPATLLREQLFPQEDVGAAALTLGSMTALGPSVGRSISSLVSGAWLTEADLESLDEL